jgi:hypothetical protein
LDLFSVRRLALLEGLLGRRHLINRFLKGLEDFGLTLTLEALEQLLGLFLELGLLASQALQFRRALGGITLLSGFLGAPP